MIPGTISRDKRYGPFKNSPILALCLSRDINFPRCLEFALSSDRKLHAVLRRCQPFLCQMTNEQ